jgi:hypothetical protein
MAVLTSGSPFALRPGYPSAQEHSAGEAKQKRNRAMVPDTEMDQLWGHVNLQLGPALSAVFTLRLPGRAPQRDIPAGFLHRPAYENPVQTERAVSLEQQAAPARR